MSMQNIDSKAGKKSLPVIDLEAELKRFDEEEKKRLGLDGPIDHWVEDMANLTFKKSEKAKITLLIGGLTWAILGARWAKGRREGRVLRILTGLALVLPLLLAAGLLAILLVFAKPRLF